MKDNIKSRLRKQDILTIPNILSFIRILLIVPIVLLYTNGHYHYSVAVIVLSALTDIVDGYIARHFNMISDFGKFIDPVADKLTQIAMLLCLVAELPQILLLIALLLIKDIFQFVFGLVVLKKTDTVNSAKWFGKVTTVVIYTTMILFFMMPEIPLPMAYALIAVCGVVMLGAMILYGNFFHRCIKNNKK